MVEPRRSSSVGIGNVVTKVGYASRRSSCIIKKKRSSSWKKMMKNSSIKKLSPVAPTPLQELFLSCKDAFKGPATVPSPHHVKTLCRILDNMKPEDVGLSSELQFFRPKTAVRGTPRITYTTIYISHNFSLCIFFLPATAVIPLHNHPGMTVFSKLLCGTVHIKSYDWVDPAHVDADADAYQSEIVASVTKNVMLDTSAVRLARLKANGVFTSPCDTSVLYPTTGGNIHQFTAITPCAILDVLGPPYSKENGRDCSYYKDLPYNAHSNGEMSVTEEEGEFYGWLEETEEPKNSEMNGIEYLGPRVDDDTCCCY